jgi:hypothetical protein
MRTQHLILLSITLGFAGCTPLQELQKQNIADFRRAVQERSVRFTVPNGTKVDSVVVDSIGKTLTVRFSREFATEAYRPANVRAVYSEVGKFFRDRFDGFTIAVQTRNRRLEELIPNYFREDPSTIDASRIPKPGPLRPAPVVRNVSRPVEPTRGLRGRNIVLWHSHGWYYNNKEDRWEWQRPRLFQTVEDMVPMSFTLPYLIPMLEKAGATVFVPRERDIQTREVVIDNDSPGESYRENVSKKGLAWTTGNGPGFSYGTPPYSVDHNPFATGTYRVVTADSLSTATATWLPEFSERGDYGVYVSYSASPENVPDAQYSIYHAGGRTDFRVNQQIGGGTWIFLGTFRFEKGSNPGIGRVVLTNASSQPGKIVAADAVRFGGGLGLIERNGRASGRPKYLEAARYFLQYAGMPDTLVYNLNGSGNDYNDDYQSRPEYANFLRGAPFGPNKNRTVPGLGIPVDLSLAFHTDAGITRNDTVVGTLSIFSTEGADSLSVFPDSMSRMANRDFADLLQTQIVGDIRALFDPIWNRRQLLDSKYSEAYRPNMPGALLELLSHQNFLDMKYMLDPRFRFHVGRAIYKAMLRFLSYQNREPYIVQPLPPGRFSSELTQDGISLHWIPTPDPLEPSAQAEAYILYTRIDSGGFDNGQLVEGTSYVVRTVKPGTIYSFKVAAVNAGGESFPSEILSACRMGNGKPVAMIVNGFDRVSGPAWVDAPAFSGFFNLEDAGVPDRIQLNYTGLQHDFNPDSPWRTNDEPGHGASFADREGSVIMGNTFDFPFVHGKSLKAAGFSFASASRTAVSEKSIDLTGYRFVDLILGKQRETRWQKPIMDSLRGPQFAAFTLPLREVLSAYLRQGGNLFLSGAYIGTDPFTMGKRDSTIIKFVKEDLHYMLATDHAARTGRVYSIVASFLASGEFMGFQPEGSEEYYGVESPDAIAPVNGAKLLLRYGENQFGAGVGYKGTGGVVAFGFPFETIMTVERRDEVMEAVLRFLLQN